MVKLSTQTILLLVLSLALFLQCQDIPLDTSRFVYISANRNDVLQRPSTDCAFRYNIVNTYKKIDNESQREAIRAGFALWQKTCPAIGFLELPQRPTLLVQFVDPSEIPTQAATVPVGLVQGTAIVAAGLRKESSGVYSIILSNTFDWNSNSLTKAIAYHAGLFMGLATSTEYGSLMSPLSVGQSIKASKSDSAAINKLYTTTCKDLTVSYLPLSLTVGGPVARTIKFDKQGTVSIKASGQMIVGLLVGSSGPEGRESGVLGFAIWPFGYNIVQEWNHAVLMYKLNNEANWHNCGKDCSFTTNGSQYVDLIFGINDAQLSDDIGGYDVVVDYK